MSMRRCQFCGTLTKEVNCPCVKKKAYERSMRDAVRKAVERDMKNLYNSLHKE